MMLALTGCGIPAWVTAHNSLRNCLRARAPNRSTSEQQEEPLLLCVPPVFPVTKLITGPAGKAEMFQHQKQDREGWIWDEQAISR